MIVVGLTGSVGMGKTTTARMFAAAGAPVFDADAAVHRLYEGEAAAAIERAFPGTAAAGRVDRAKLAARVVGDKDALARLEAIVHPLVRKAEEAFLTDAEKRGALVAVLDIPLLLEGGGHRRVNVVVVVSAPAATQRARVLERPGMTEEKLDHLLARQMSDSQKRTHADFVVDTGAGLEPARIQVRNILQELSKRSSRR
ncbi:MAG TPA: dephospho-CoA kinase [Xanthobacteraceae bacterium]|nr:dephospho-CoA kinase [Xanthobacteraceae bacterium]